MCWWLDAYAPQQTIKLRDKFKIKTYVETGTFRGIGIKFYSYRFQEVLGCEINDEYFGIAKKRIRELANVKIYKQSSSDFLKSFLEEYRNKKRHDTVLFYLDAHFYDPKAKSEDKWVVLKELKALKEFLNCVIVIHDFDCENLGHLQYGDESLDFSLIREDVLKVNPNFYFYSNTREFSGIYAKEKAKSTIGIALDADTLETIEYHNNDRLRHRGILYCTPGELDLSEFELTKIKNENKYYNVISPDRTGSEN